jgi:Xaa-Pro aminopeptidase
MEGRTLKKYYLTDFAKGIIAGAVGSAIIFGVIIAFHFLNKRDKELTEYVEQQQAIEALREDYVNRDPVEYFDDFPGVRGAADGAAADFIRKRDEAVQRFRSRLSSRAGLVD